MHSSKRSLTVAPIAAASANRRHPPCSNSVQSNGFSSHSSRQCSSSSGLHPSVQPSPEWLWVSVSPQTSTTRRSRLRGALPQTTAVAQLRGIRVSLSGAGSDGATVGAATTSFTFSGLGPGIYTVTVSAVNGDGTGAGTSGSATIPTTPSVPTNVGVVVNGQSVTVSWDASDDDGFDPSILYLVSFGAESGQTESTSITFDRCGCGDLHGQCCRFQYRAARRLLV